MDLPTRLKFYRTPSNFHHIFERRQGGQLSTLHKGTKELRCDHWRIWLFVTSSLQTPKSPSLYPPETAKVHPETLINENSVRGRLVLTMWNSFISVYTSGIYPPDQLDKSIVVGYRWEVVHPVGRTCRLAISEVHWCLCRRYTDVDGPSGVYCWGVETWDSWTS